MRRERENHSPDGAYQARVSDLDPFLASPYGPAAREGRRNRPDTHQILITFATDLSQNCLHSPGPPHTSGQTALTRSFGEG